jgi:ABC-type bacteriocin/lantibiotic exporter with double-glycine peptidase domain
MVIHNNLIFRLYHQVNNVFCCLVEFVVAFVFCWEITLAGLGLFCCLFILIGWLSKQMRKNINKIAEVDDSANNSVEIIENTRTIQLLTKEEFFLEKFSKKLHSFWKYQKNVAIFDSVMFAFTNK